MILRSATINDIDAIQSLAEAIWPVAYRDILSTAQLKYMLEKFYNATVIKDQMLTKGHQFYLITNELEIKLGFAAVSKENNTTYKLQKLYVLPSQQGKYLGKMLLEEVIKYCKENGGKQLILNVNRYNSAQFFYKKQGFKIIEEIDIAIGNNYFMNDFVMERNL